jgi:hypothetical protein
MSTRSPAASADRIGFALGGLAGFNAHGVGFLLAAHKLEVKPAIITCTSGMVIWTAKWLAGKDLERELQQQITDCNRFPPPFGWLNALWLGCAGYPGVFRPAVPEYWTRWCTPTAWGSASEWLNRLLPAQMYVPVRTAEDLEETARSLNQSPTPVAFNTFHPKSGKTHLHINSAAAEFLGVTPGDIEATEKYVPITREGVAGAVWLYNYGFDRRLNPHGLVDGAYSRQFLIAELKHCGRIYAVRPQNRAWIGHLPANAFEIEDLRTEMWLNSAYAAEVAEMTRINKLIQAGALKDSVYREIELIEVQVRHQYGFFDYFVEHESVYKESLKQSLRILGEHEHRTVGTGPAREMIGNMA